MLEEDGYVVAGEAADGEAAVELTASLRPDLVIMDIKMPGLDGISAAERITAEHMAPVVILTAFSQRDLVLRARDAGAMAFLVKPFTKADLVPAIEIAVSRFQEFSALESEWSSLKDRLEVRKLLDRAKGILQAERGLSEPEAFRWIQKSSMDRRMTMRAVAEEVLEAAQPPASKSLDAQIADGGGARPTADGGDAAQAAGSEPGAADSGAGGDAPKARAGGQDTDKRARRGCTTPVCRPGSRPLVPLCRPRDDKRPRDGKQRARENLWCHVSLPRAGTFSTRFHRALDSTVASPNLVAQRT